MRALILGTSNGFFSLGYVGAIKNRFETVENVSLGASPSIMAPYRLRDVDLRSFDYLFVETAINDFMMLNNGAFSEEGLYEALAWIAASAREAGVKPVALIVPGLYVTPVLEQVRRAIADTFGEWVVDFRAIAEGMAAHLGRPVGDLYHDPAHMRPELTNLVMSAALDRILAAHGPEPVAGTPAGAPAEFAHVRLADWVKDGKVEGLKSAPIQVTTSVVSDLMYVLQEGQDIVLDIGSASLAGFIVNQSNTRCLLEVSGNRKVVNDLRLDYGRTDHKLIVTSLLHPVSAGEDGKVRLRVLPAIFPEGEIAPSYYLKRDRLEVCGFITTRKTGATRERPGLMAPPFWEPGPGDIAALSERYLALVQPAPAK